MASLFLLPLLAASAMADYFYNIPDCLTKSKTVPNAFHFGTLSDDQYKRHWIVARDGLVEGSVLQRAPDTYEGDPGYGYYAMATCRYRTTNSGSVFGTSGFIGQALSPTSPQSSGLAELCLEASGVNESNLTISLQKCAYADIEGSANNAPIPTQNFQTQLHTLVYLGDQKDPVYLDYVDYKVRFDDEGVVRLDYEKGAYMIPDESNDEETFVIYIAGDSE